MYETVPDQDLIKDYETLRIMLDDMELDVAKFRAGQKLCASRLRKRLQVIKQVAHSMRKEISAEIHARGGW
jgi:hypothetical protein